MKGILLRPPIDLRYRQPQNLIGAMERKQTTRLRSCIGRLIGNVVFATCLGILGQPPAASAQVLPPNTRQLSIHSQPGDPWSTTFGKSDWLYREGDGQFICQGFDWIGDGSLNHLTFIVRATNGDFWHIAFTALGELTPGDYEGVSGQSLDVGGLGRGCLTSTGKFTIVDIAHQGSGNFISMTRLAARFEFHCYGLPPALTGVLYYNSNGFPPPPILRMKQRPPMPNTAVGVAYSEKVEAEGGTPPYQWETYSGQLPPGLSLDADGLISGTPTTPGTYSFNIRNTDSAPWVNGYPSQVVSRDFSILVNPASFEIAAALPPSATKDGAYAFQFPAIGGSPPYKWSLIEGQVPTGLLLTEDGKMSGITTSLGTFTFTLRASDSAAHQAEKTYIIKVVDPPLIANVKYKVNKRKLIITGEKFDPQAVLFIDGQEVEPKSQDSERFVVKQLSLLPGSHEFRVVNPDGGTAGFTRIVE